MYRCMPTLFCIELGIRETHNLCRMTSSIIAVADKPDDAVAYVERQCPELLRCAAVQRVFEVERVVMDWRSGNVAILPRD